MADGSNSGVRASLGVPGVFRPYAYGALFALLPDPGRTFGAELVQRHAGPGCHTTLGFLPTGLPWGSGIDTVGDGVVDTHADFVTTLYFNLRGDEYDAAAASGGYLGGGGDGRLQAWKDRCSALMPEAADLVQRGVADARQV